MPPYLHSVRVRTGIGLLAFGTLLPPSADAGIVRETSEAGVVTLSNRGARPGTSSSTTRSSSFHNPTHNPTAITRFDEPIRQAAQLYQIPEALIRAVITVESGFDPRAVSRAQARGLMQLVPATATRMQVRDVFDPRENIFGGVRYLRILANLYSGDLVLTVAAYNAGEGAVLRYGGVPPYPETRDYVSKVVALYRRLEATSGR